MELPLFQRAFPDVPWIFLYRDPVEVLVSQLRMPGMQMIPGMLAPSLFAIEPTETASQSRGLSRAHARPILRTGYAAHPAMATRLLINYRQLPQALWTTILPHFGVAMQRSGSRADGASGAVGCQDARSRFHPGYRGEAAGSYRLGSQAAKCLREIYRQLEVLRADA